MQLSFNECLTSVWVQGLTFGDNSFQADDIRVRELTHDAGLAQEVLPLFLWVPRLQGLDCYSHLPSNASLHHPPKYFPKLAWLAEGKQEEMLELVLWDFIKLKAADF